MHNINNFRITNIRTIFFKSNAQKQQLRFMEYDFFFNHQLHHLRSYVFSHTVIHTTTCQNNFRMIPRFQCFLSQIIGINSYTMTSY